MLLDSVPQLGEYINLSCIAGKMTVLGGTGFDFWQGYGTLSSPESPDWL